jgi:hypothetical protein
MHYNECVDVDMKVLRRSERIAAIQTKNAFISMGKTKSKEITNTTTKCQIKKDSRCIKKITTKKKTPKKDKVIMYHKLCSKDITKINHLFPLIKKYSNNEIDKKFKYSIIQHILKGIKTIGIENNITAMYKNVDKLCKYVSTVMITVSIYDIQESLETILNYPELYYISYEEQYNNKDIESLSNMLNSMHVMQKNNCNISDELSSLFTKCNIV